MSDMIINVLIGSVALVIMAVIFTSGVYIVGQILEHSVFNLEKILGFLSFVLIAILIHFYIRKING